MDSHFRQANIALVSMPWAPLDSPPIGVGLLKSVLVEAGHRCQVFYLSTKFYKLLTKRFPEQSSDFVNQITFSTYSQVYNWLFSRAAFGMSDENYLDKYSEDQRYFNLRLDFEKLVRSIAQENWGRFQLIGFSCNFFQTVSSLALAKFIKEAHKETPIVLGGSGLDNESATQILQNAPWIDSIITGEAECVFPNSISDIISRKKQLIQGSPSTNEQFNKSPLPNYDEFFIDNSNACCAIEASRGCWYKPICSFCNMVPEGGYRVKKNILDEIKFLKNRYKISRVEFADLVYPSKKMNIFSDTKALDMNFTFNLRVNSLRQRELYKLGELRKGGVKSIFIGIESLHPMLLKMMNKGHSAIHAISLLKWMKFYDIRADWFILFGVPGEKTHHYYELLSTLKKITHLRCPSIQGIIITRHSHYFEQFKNEIKPTEAYQYIYPSSYNLNAIALEFDHVNIDHMKSKLLNIAVIRQTGDFLRTWRQSNSNKGTS